MTKSSDESMSAPGSKRHRTCAHDLGNPCFPSQTELAEGETRESEICNCPLSGQVHASELCGHLGLPGVPALTSPLQGQASPPRGQRAHGHLSAGRPVRTEEEGLG